MATAAFVVSLASIVLAGLAVVYTRSAARANAALAAIETERRADEREHLAAQERASRKAELRVRVALASTETHLLKIVNLGPAEAVDVRVEAVATIGPGDLPELDGGPTTVPAGEEVLYLIHPDYDTARHFQIRLWWTDQDGSHDKRRDLQLP